MSGLTVSQQTPSSPPGGTETQMSKCELAVFTLIVESLYCCYYSWLECSRSWFLYGLSFYWSKSCIDLHSKHPAGLDSEPELRDLMREIAAAIPSKWKDVSWQLGLDHVVLEVQ